MGEYFWNHRVSRPHALRTLPYSLILNSVALDDSRIVDTVSTAGHGSRVQNNRRRRAINTRNNAVMIDDVIVISATTPRRFREGWNWPGHTNEETIIIDDGDAYQGQAGAVNTVDETGTARSPHNVRNNNCERSPIASDLDDCLEENCATKEPFFSCPVCLGALMEEMSTVCGHIFCKRCLSMAIRVQNKCPTCRQELTTNDIHRIYLPTLQDN